MRKFSMMMASTILLAGATCADAATQRRGAAAYDWYFVTHGGSGDLDFGDGDWAEGVSLVSMSCLPSSGNVSLTSGRSGDVTLQAGRQRLASSLDENIPTGNPVLRALRTTGVVRLTAGGTSRTLTARAAGRRALREFFNYCGAARR